MLCYTSRRYIRNPSKTASISFKICYFIVNCYYCYHELNTRIVVGIQKSNTQFYYIGNFFKCGNNK